MTKEGEGWGKSESEKDRVTRDGIYERPLMGYICFENVTHYMLQSHSGKKLHIFEHFSVGPAVHELFIKN